MILDAMKVCQKVLANAMKIERKNPIRNPTKKELDRHPKLMKKQRRLVS
jgi:hypothetical protein